MTYNEYVKTYEAMLSIYLDGFKPTNIPSEVKKMVAAADKLVDFQEAYPNHTAKYEAQF
jgi:hypothetical protein|tara:strand:+ start:12835 stop:13011 length:177 start_codon:yes stop_codon:yes gene_type:complete